MTVENKLISLSLFSGAFGLDLGLEKAGFNTVSVIEIDRDCNKTIAINRPHLSKCAIPRDIREIDSQQLLQEGGRTLELNRPLQVGELDLVTGGPPCQPFSTAGKRLSVGDPRGSLFIEFLRLIQEIQPRFFIMENVRGLLSAPIKHRPHKYRGSEHLPLEPEEMPGAALKVILSEIENIGYQVTYKLLQAADYGVPQTRLRVFFLASRDREKLTFPTPTHTKESQSLLPQWLTLKSAIENINDDSIECSSYSSQRLKYLKLLKAGQNWRFLPEEIKAEAMGGAYKSGGGKVGFYRRLSLDKPSPTITTSPHQKATDMCHPEKLRPLSVRECARIQTFPDSWKFYGSVSSKYKQIGNAVPVLLGKAIGDHLYRVIYGKEIVRESTKTQLSIFENISYQPSKNKKTYHDKAMTNIQNDKDIIKALLKDAKVKKPSLLTEKIFSLNNYINITEEELSRFKWIDKKGKDIPMVQDKEIDNIIAKRDYYLKDISEEERKHKKLAEAAVWFSEQPIIKNLLKEFISTKKANNIASQIKSIDQIKTKSTAFSETLNSLSAGEKENVVNLFLQKDIWDYKSIKSLQNQANVFAESISLRAILRQENISIHNQKEFRSFVQYLLKNWYRLKEEPDLLVEDCKKLKLIKSKKDIEYLKIASKLFFLDASHLSIALLFLEEIIKMKKSIPELAGKAIITGNPFLFRSLFLDFDEAKEFAVGGKLSSSLETKYGNLFEKLMVSFNYCQEIYDGGVDVLVGDNAYDIKSGPNVMNKSMVDAFSAKQVLIQDRQIIPEIKSYKIALGYGKRENLNSFMAKIDSEILTAREAWKKITGIKHSPEIVYAISGLIAQFFGSKSIISSILEKGESANLDKINNQQFQEIFDYHFDEIELGSQEKKEITIIKSLFS